LIFYLDENLDGEAFWSVLLAAGLEVELHRNHFRRGERDEVWIPKVAANGWIAVTGDIKTRFTVTQKRAIIESNAQMIHVRHGKNATHAKLATNFVNSLDKIRDFLEKHELPCLGVLMRPSSIDDYFRGKPGSVKPIDLL
jgi:hypothetical protein